MRSIYINVRRNFPTPLFLAFDFPVPFSALGRPVFEPMREPNGFARVTLDRICGTVVWFKGADLAPEAFYKLSPVEYLVSK